MISGWLMEDKDPGSLYLREQGVGVGARMGWAGTFLLSREVLREVARDC